MNSEGVVRQGRSGGRGIPFGCVDRFPVTSYVRDVSGESVRSGNECKKRLGSCWRDGKRFDREFWVTSEFLEVSSRKHEPYDLRLVYDPSNDLLSSWFSCFCVRTRVR